MTNFVATEKKLFKILFILVNLARYPYLLRDEFHFLCADQIGGITNFYPLLRLMEIYKFVEVYKIFDDNAQRLQHFEQRNINNCIYRLAPAGWNFLQRFERLEITVRFNNNDCRDLDILKPVEFKFNRLINHSILISQALSFLLKDMLKDGATEIEVFTDFLLKRVLVGKGEKIPDFLIFFRNSEGELVKYWGEVERSRKKTPDIKALMQGVSFASKNNFKVLVFYPTNARAKDGFFISHRKNIQAAAANFLSLPSILNFYEFQLLDSSGSKVLLLGGKGFRSAGAEEFIPTIFSLVAMELSEATAVHGWKSDQFFEKNDEVIILFNCFSYFISKEGGIYTVTPVFEVTTQEYSQTYVEDEMDFSKSASFNSRSSALQKATQLIIERYGLKEFLRILEIYAPNTYKVFLNLKNSKLRFIDRKNIAWNKY